MDWGKIYFAVKIDFKCQGSSVKHCPAIITASQMALDFARYLWSQAPFQILANQADCGLAGHAHDGPPWKLGLCCTIQEARIKPKTVQPSFSCNPQIINDLLDSSLTFRRKLTAAKEGIFSIWESFLPLSYISMHSRLPVDGHITKNGNALRKGRVGAEQAAKHLAGAERRDDKQGSG